MSESPWNDAAEVQPKPGNYIAVRDETFSCDWHFARFDGREWTDLNGGQRLKITHWMELPLSPSGSRP